MNKFALRVSWVLVKAAELLLPVLWNVAIWAFWTAVLFVIILVAVIFL